MDEKDYSDTAAGQLYVQTDRNIIDNTGRYINPKPSGTRTVIDQLLVDASGNRIINDNTDQHISARAGERVTALAVDGGRDNSVQATNARQNIVANGRNAKACGVSGKNTENLKNDITGGSIHVRASHGGNATYMKGGGNLEINGAAISVVAGNLKR